MANLISLPLLKFSCATDRPEEVKFSWKHTVLDLVFVIDSFRSEDASNAKRLKVIQRTQVLEEFNVEEKARDASEMLASARKYNRNTPNEQLPISVITRSPLVAIRYIRADGLVRRLQMKFASDHDFRIVFEYLTKIGCRISHSVSPGEKAEQPLSVERPGPSCPPGMLATIHGNDYAPTSANANFPTGASLISASSVLQSNGASQRSGTAMDNAPNSQYSRYFQTPKRPFNGSSSHMQDSSSGRLHHQLPASNISHRPFTSNHSPTHLSHESRKQLMGSSEGTPRQYPSLDQTLFPHLPTPVASSEALHERRGLSRGYESSSSALPLIDERSALGSLGTLEQLHRQTTQSSPPRALPLLELPESAMAGPVSSVTPIESQAFLRRATEEAIHQTTLSEIRPSTAPLLQVDDPDTLSQTIPPRRELPFPRASSTKKEPNISGNPQANRPSSSLADLPPLPKPKFAGQAPRALSRGSTAERVENSIPEKRQRASSNVPLSNPSQNAHKKAPALTSTTEQAEDSPAYNVTLPTVPSDVEHFKALMRPTPTAAEKENLANYAAQSAEEREAILGDMVAEHIGDNGFLTLCEDVWGCWRRIGLGLE